MQTWDRTRTAMGPIGAFLPNIPFAAPVPTDRQQDAARRLERAGYSTMWNNEGVGGKDALVQAALLLSATEQAVIGTGIASMWARAPQTAHGAVAQLIEAFGERVVLGLGVGYPFQAEAVGRDFGKPIATAVDYLTRMNEPVAITPAPDVTYPRLLAANGPRMLDTAREYADGALPILQPPSLTAYARSLLGPNKLLVVGLTVAIDEDPEVAHRDAVSFASQSLGMPGSPYAAALERHGIAPFDADGNLDDSVLRQVVPHGTVLQVVDAVREHLRAGADHVRLSTATGGFSDGIDQLEAIGPELAASLTS
ncbi:LLM class flavin-dependent oxidoreductase [Gordonia sp. CPCC 206044]|uniref:LLM class flavin-dependent oxidoreductase n=1 Tax=Gordonia sp. CPCC 206044 TaxID=3140793 RepID=UPI003AF3E5C3